jgi:hypothetical protein
MLAVHLSDDDKALLDFEGRHWADPSRKIAEIRQTFGIGHTTYLQRLNTLIDTQAALAYAPMTVNRVRRTRARFRRSRRVPVFTAS